MKRILLYFLCLTSFFIFPLTVASAEDGSASDISITVVIPQAEPTDDTFTPTPEPALNPADKHPFPVGVSENQENGRREIIKTYELDMGEKPEDIPKESFIRDGWIYELTDIIKKETASADTWEHVETVTLPSDTKDMEAVFGLLSPTLEYQSEEGYTGMLSLDISSIKVETAGTKNSSYPISVTREYPDLSSNDTSLIPKTVSENGRTLTLENIEWSTQNKVTIDYEQLPESYKAVAKYTGTAYKTTATGYTITAEYHGTVTKIVSDKTMYVAHFIGIPIITPMVNTPSSAPLETPLEPEPADIETSMPAVTEEADALPSEAEQTETIETTHKLGKEERTAIFHRMMIVFVFIGIGSLPLCYLKIKKGRKDA